MRNFAIGCAALLLFACTSRQDTLLKKLAPADALIAKVMAYRNFSDSLFGKDGNKNILPDSTTRVAMVEMRKEIRDALNSVPDTLAKPLHDFAMEFPEHPRSESYLYVSSVLAEKSGRIFETAKWCEDYLKTYPKGVFYKDALTSAASNFERSGTFDKAILYYDRIAKEFPKTSIGKDAGSVAAMLRKGLTTPEQQMEFILSQRDSSGEQ